MSTLNKALLGVIALLMLVGISMLVSKKLGGETYYAVFMTSGDMYFGKLRSFPKLGLANVYALQRNPENTATPFSLAKFGDAFWGPSDFMQLNKQNVLWMSRLKPDSQVIKFITNREGR